MIDVCARAILAPCAFRVLIVGNIHDKKKIWREPNKGKAWGKWAELSSQSFRRNEGFKKVCNL